LYDIFSFISIVPGSKSRIGELAVGQDKAVAASTSTPQF